ncbi:MAG TPA: sigma-70 family RNA polymerase sigma factor [Jatrophihabitantaceae bacterium]|jgi:RNA polymerase sigma factor for flagellar operon FliA
MANSAALAPDSAQIQPDVTQLVEATMPLVGHLVREVLAKVPSHVCRDDLVSAGMVALVTSAQGFDATRGVPFARFAAIRIRGALTDELRRMDWAVRSVRSRARAASTARDQLAAALGRSPSTDEVSAALGVSPLELEALHSDLERATVLSLDGLAPEVGADLVPDQTAGPETLLLRREELGYLHDAIAELPERLRFVVTAYFFEQRQMTDIAAELGVTESRISQLRAEALRLVRDGMNSQLEPAAVAQPETSRAAGTRKAYFAAIAARTTLAGRLAMSTPRGEMVARQLTPAMRPI